MPPASEQFRQPPGQDAGHELGEPRTPSHDLTVVLMADGVTPSIARARLRGWLRAFQWPASRMDELVLAVSEAVSNCVEHGYRALTDTAEHAGDFSARDMVDRLQQPVELYGHYVVNGDGYSHVELTVRDHGQWRPPSTLPSTRGRGIALMRACVDEFDLQHSDEGTTVFLCSRSVPPAPNGT
jgi:serine/threonine-protein kinase RsbW